MYYTNVYPAVSYRNNSDPYFCITYGHIGGDAGSGSWEREVESIKANPTKVIYTQYKNLLLRSGDADVFKMRDGERLIELLIFG